jgi:hypothetical protein
MLTQFIPLKMRNPFINRRRLTCARVQWEAHSIGAISPSSYPFLFV